MNIHKEIIQLNYQKKYDELVDLVDSINVKQLIETATTLAGDTGDTFISFWDAVLIATDNLSEYNDKRFKIVSAVLDQLNKVFITHKHAYDIISRLFIDLPKFSPAQLIEFIEYCTESMRCGEAKCVGWKDLFPPVLKLLSDYPKMMLNGIGITGPQFRQECIQTLVTMKWPIQTLTPIAMMFREMPITKDERAKILAKFAESLQQLEPSELPPLANQLFSLTTNASLVLMVLFSFQRYFHKYYYKKLFSDMESDSMTESDSIDPYPYSDKEVREAEETILYYLSKSTQYSISEDQVVANCRVGLSLIHYPNHIVDALSPSPKYILTPFILNALLSMCNGNRDPSSTSILSNSPILLFIRNVIKNNEIEKKLCKQSAWCRDTSDASSIDLNKIFAVLIDQSNKGMDSVTPGIVSLAFVLLKTKDNPELNSIGINFLEQFVKKRRCFCPGIVQEIVNLMIVNQDCIQYVECLTRLSLNCTLVVSECVGSISHILENMLLIPGQKAIEMTMAISPLMKISDKIRDLFINVLRKAIYDRDTSTQQMGVHGFCVILKMIRDNNSRRIRTGNGVISQSTISGLSLASQITPSNRTNKSRHFDMLALEILGILKKCFNQPSHIKVTLYDGLSKAIDFNPKIIPHLLPFFTHHFVQYFDISDLSFVIKFDKIVRERQENVFDIWDNLGKLVFLMGRIVVLARTNDFSCEIDSTAKTLDNILNKIDVLTVEQLGLVDRLNERTSHVAIQYLNTIEALMGFAIHSAAQDNNYLTKILRLYKHHAATLSKLVAANATKKGRKGRNADSTANTSTNTKAIPFHPENIWDLPTLEKFLQLIYENNVPFATSNQSNALHTNVDFGCYIVQTALNKVEKLYKDSQNRQLTHSKSAFKHLCDISRLAFESVKNLPDIIERFSFTFAKLSIELFCNCLMAGDVLFKRKLDEFLKFIVNHPVGSLSQSIIKITEIIQKHIENLVLNEDDENYNPIANSFLQCLELLYNNLPENDVNGLEAFKWIHKVSLSHDISKKNMNRLHKLLFDLHMQNESGSYFDTVALQISHTLGQHEEVSLNVQFQLQSLTTDTVETCILYLCTCLRRQIEFVEYFITKAKSLHSKLKITGQYPNIVKLMTSTERKICLQLIHICNAATHLANSTIPLETCMDHVKRLLIQLYVCLTNMTKYLILRHSLLPVSCRSVTFDLLVRAAGRSLVHKVYCMITYVEESQKPEKVIRETKFLPKLVLRIETFNKYVIHLGKKTKDDLVSHLHIGRVRYFKLKKLQDVLDQTIKDCSQSDVDESKLDEQEVDEEIDEVSDSDSKSNLEVDDSSTSKTSSTTTSSDLIRESDDDFTKFKKNMAKINKKAKRTQNTKEKDAPPTKRKRK